MKRANDLQPQLPLHDYDLALQSAVSWLGDRYLLAAPIPARRPDRYAEAGFAGTRAHAAMNVRARRAISSRPTPGE